MKARLKQRPATFDTDMTQNANRSPAPDPIDPVDEELDTVFADFPQNEACIELYRTSDKGGRAAFIEDIMPSEFSFGYVCRVYGGGKYIAKGKYQDGSVAKRSFEIEGPSFPIKRKVPASDPVTHGPVDRQAVPVVEIPRREDGSFDGAAVMASMMNMMKAMIQETKGSKADWLSEMREMRAIFGTGDKPVTPVAEAISMLKQGIELGSAAGGDGGIPWMLIVDKLQGPITELVSALTRKPTMVNPPPGVPLQPPPMPGPTASSPQPETVNMETMLLTALKGMLPILCTGAAREADPANYVDFLLDQIPEKFYPTAKSWLEKSDCLDQLAAMDPGIRYQEKWWVLLRDGLLQALNEELGHAPRTVQPEPASDATADRSADL